MRRIRVGSRLVTPSEVFDTYWRFAFARQEVFWKRIEGRTPPWTSDDILRAHRFTNVYRASDRVSQYLIKHVVYDGDSSAEEVFFRTLLFKLFNRISTWERLSAAVGPILWREFSFDRYNCALDQLFASGGRVYSAAYIMPSPAFGEKRKHSNHLRLLELMMRQEAPKRIANAASLRNVFDVLRNYPSLGDFLAFQFTIDLNYSEVVDHLESEFVVAGPGARDGIRKCFSDTGGLDDAGIIKLMTEIADDEFARLGLPFRKLFGHALQLIDCQNIFCEVDKYARVAHPKAAGRSGRTRIKQKYVADLAPLPQAYPKKWKLTVPAEMAGAVRALSHYGQPSLPNVT